MTELTNETFADATGSGLAVVDYFADWCGPCQMFGPTFAKVAEEYAGRAGLFKLNIDKEPDLTATAGVMSVPTIIFYKDGAEVARSSGVLTEAALKAKIDSLL